MIFLSYTSSISDSQQMEKEKLTQVAPTDTPAEKTLA
jgi:hypothetical protein